jgi:hypothetical protein
MKPGRIQAQDERGFNMQAVSRAQSGLSCSVTRAGITGAISEFARPSLSPVVPTGGCVP